MFHKSKILLLALLALATTPIFAAEFHPHEDILSTAQEYVESQLHRFSGDAEVSVGRIDKRSKFKLCNQPLSAYETANELKPGRNVVGVRCDGDKPWKIFVSIKISVYEMVITARMPIPKGQLVSEPDIELRPQDVSKLHRGYFTQESDVKGLITKRHIKTGTIITPSALARQKMVTRNSRVKIVMKAGALIVHSTGKALSDGRKGQIIKVKNIGSGNVISATVVAPGRVEVIH